MPAIAIKDGHIEIFEEANVEHEEENRWAIAGHSLVKADYIILLPDE